jgi:glycosyltransferase involved in cell wall biosynthesis
MSRGPKIVVITPIKNEAWILQRFLSVTSEFADHIVIADQDSTDASVSICQRYPKVTLIHNSSDGYDEAARQRLLIEAARDLVPDPKIILALDADEILASDALGAPGWRSMLAAAPGTVLYFEKPDLYLTTGQCIRYARPWPLGYVDDGAEHKPKRIHSIRIPTPKSSPKLHVQDVKILHYALTRMDALRSKQRMYCVVEHILGVSPFWTRRLAYNARMDWRSLGQPEPSRAEWFEGWERLGIDMHTIPSEVYHWQDYEVLRYFTQYGERRFWIDDIWDMDWESCRAHARSIGEARIQHHRICAPPSIIEALLRVLDKSVSSLRGIRGSATINNHQP